jgi:hypothetical protein
MACPNFKKGLKMAFGPLGVNGPKMAQGTPILVDYLLLNSIVMQLDFRLQHF